MAQQKFLGGLIYKGLRGKEKRVVSEVAKAIVEENSKSNETRQDVLSGLGLAKLQSQTLQAVIYYMDKNDTNFLLISDSMFCNDKESINALSDRGFILQIRTNEGVALAAKPKLISELYEQGWGRLLFPKHPVPGKRYALPEKKL